MKFLDFLFDFRDLFILGYLVIFMIFGYLPYGSYLWLCDVAMRSLLWTPTFCPLPVTLDIFIAYYI